MCKKKKKKIENIPWNTPIPERKVDEITIYGIDGRSLQSVMRTDAWQTSKFSLTRNMTAIASYWFIVRVNSHTRQCLYMHFCVCPLDGYWKSCARHPVAQIAADRRKCLLDCASFRVSQQLSRNFRSSCSCFRVPFSFSRFFPVTTTADATLGHACSNLRRGKQQIFWFTAAVRDVHHCVTLCY